MAAFLGEAESRDYEVASPNLTHLRHEGARTGLLFASRRSAGNLLRRSRRRFGLTLSPPSGGRPDVLVYPEEVGRVVFLLQRSQALVVVAIGRLESCIALIVHHEIR